MGLSGLVWLRAQGGVLRWLDEWGWRRRKVPEHLAVGLRGEREALFHLRGLGYVVVARRWRTAKLRGDVDLIGWDGDRLCFVEVKTRTGRDGMDPAEAAVDEPKREMLRRMARAYGKRFPAKLRGEVAVRFDVVSVYLQPTGVEFEVYRGAFGWQE